MQDLAWQFSPETRQAMFAAMMNVTRRGGGFIEVEDIVVGLLQAQSVADVLHRADKNAGDLCEAVDRQRVERLKHASIDDDRRPFQDPAAGFSIIPLSNAAIALHERLSEDFRSARPESVAPAAVLAAILRFDAATTALFRDLGVTEDAFRPQQGTA